MSIRILSQLDATSLKIINLGAQSASSDADTLGARNTAISAAIAGLNPAKVVSASDLSLAAWLTSSSYASNMSLYPAGTILLLPSASDPTAAQFYQNGGSAGTAADFSGLGNDPSASEVRSQLSAGTGLAYSGGQFSVSGIGQASTIGNGTLTSFTFSVPTNDVQVSVYDLLNSGAKVEPTIAVASNVVTVSMAVAPASGQYRVCISYIF